jgi:DNA-binding CsgD family transcriptional regulator/PAS domain-containing protein
MLNDLIRDVYASVTQPGSMVSLMARLGSRFQADAAYLFTTHSDSAPEAISLSHNIAPTVVADFASYWCKEDIWAEAARAHGMMHRGVVVVGEDLVPAEHLHRSRFYNEFAAQAGMGSMLGSVLFDGREEGGDIPFTNLCWYRPVGKESFAGEDKRLLRTLLPHLQQGLKLQWQMQQTRLQDLTTGLPGVGTPLASFILDWSGRVLSRNARAENLLGGSRALVRCKDGRVVGLGAQSSPPVDEAMLQCCREGRAVRILVREEGSGELFRATLNTMPADAETHLGLFGRPCCLLLIELPRDDMRETFHLVGQLYGLTAAEVEVLTALVNGMTAEQIAKLKVRTIATVRTQIRSVLLKTGSDRQTDVVRLVGRLGC